MNFSLDQNVIYPIISNFLLSHYCLRCIVNIMVLLDKFYWNYVYLEMQIWCLTAFIISQINILGTLLCIPRYNHYNIFRFLYLIKSLYVKCSYWIVSPNNTSCSVGSLLCLLHQQWCWETLIFMENSSNFYLILNDGSMTFQ